ncbi:MULTISPECIES: hypothetical protein [Vibrio]|uniref:hypothetical protein n=1 Tax=Vibrio TaxID=662 RepID=UPI001CDD5BB8|nr:MULTISPECIES: hypothetical protein [Vibrio]EIK0770544.1 hypothetical protein [Vibrio alginolyticus]MCA2487703.1 hypothetical protein [Vibrio alginolyticus]MDW1550171.1 hypothetical protein [Vibrio sp. YT-18]MDW1780437.1 hypothetical protein [Vibrio sp. Vb2134]MDW2084805.1 hypothetical protein [Vibrio sp. 2134-1]
MAIHKIFKTKTPNKKQSIEEQSAAPLATRQAQPKIYSNVSLSNTLLASSSLMKKKTSLVKKPNS